MKTTKRMMGLGLGVMMSTLASPAFASSIGQAIDKAFLGENVPVVFEDDDFAVLINNDNSVNTQSRPTVTVGDILAGVLRIQAIHGSNDSVPPQSIKDFQGVASPASTVLGSGGVNELTAIYALKIVGIGNDTADPANKLFYVAPVNGPVTITSANTYANFDNQAVNTFTLHTSGSIFDFYEDSTPDFTSTFGGPLAPFNSAANGTYVGSLGFAGTPTDGGANGSGANSLGEFFVIRANTPAALVLNGFEFNLNALNLPSGSFLSLFQQNDVSGPGFDANFIPLNTIQTTAGQTGNFGDGAEFYGYASYSVQNSGGWNYISDGDFAALITPIPVAVYPGIALFGMMGVAIRRYRQQQALKATA